MQPLPASARFAAHRLLALGLTLRPAATHVWASVAMVRSAAVELPEAADPGLCHELLWMGMRDQLARSLPDRLLPWTGLAFVDRSHTERMRAIVATHGWPRRSQVGPLAAQAAWLLVQHADHDRTFQQACLRLLQEAVAVGEAEPGHLAYLTDRVRVGAGLPQVYGTQMHNGSEPWPIEMPEGVDERRAVVGLEPLADYVARFRAPRPA